MGQHYCMNCLRQVPAGKCPLCGFDPAAVPPVSQAMAQAILAGRYLTGRAVQKTGYDITYRGRDLVEDKPVLIQEYFPAGQARRSGDGIGLCWAQKPESTDDLLRRVRESASAPIVEAFPENGTVYVIRRELSAPPPKQVSRPAKESELVPFLIALAIVGLLFLLCFLSALPIWQRLVL